MIYKNYVFDIDGTMVDSRNAFILSLQEAVAEYCPRKNNPEVLEGYFGKSVQQVVDLLQLKNPGDFIQKWERHFNEQLLHFEFFDSIEEAILQLHLNGARIFILTSRSASTIAPVLETGVLQGRLTGWISADDTPRQKPHPDPLLRLLEKWHCKEAETLYIGDTDADRRCAHAAGVSFAFAGWNNTAAEIPSDFPLESPLDLLKSAI